MRYIVLQVPIYQKEHERMKLQIFVNAVPLVAVVIASADGRLE